MVPRCWVPAQLRSVSSATFPWIVADICAVASRLMGLTSCQRDIAGVKYEKTTPYGHTTTDTCTAELTDCNDDIITTHLVFSNIPYSYIVDD